jgi:hypothetical protein
MKLNKGGFSGSILWLSFQDVKDPDRCCGFGGAFSLNHPSLSQQINDTTVKQLVETNAEMVVTSCPGCMLHLANGLYRCVARPRWCTSLKCWQLPTARWQRMGKRNDVEWFA